MKEFLTELLSRYFPNARYRLIPHEGRSDLARSIPRKVRGMAGVASAFIIVHDQHSTGDCRKLKRDLASKAPHSENEIVVRIVCRELESWLLGDLEGLGEALQMPGLNDRSRKRKFRHPDNLVNAAEELRKLAPHYSKTAGARSVGKSFDPTRCCSPSFNVFFRTVQRLL